MESNQQKPGRNCTSRLKHKIIKSIERFSTIRKLPDDRIFAMKHMNLTTIEALYSLSKLFLPTVFGVAVSDDSENRCEVAGISLILYRSDLKLTPYAPMS